LKNGLSEKQRNLLKVAISGFSLSLCIFATFYSLVVFKVSFAYIVLFFAPIVLASAWWPRKGVILTFGIVVFLLIINFYFPPPVSITDLVRAAILLLVSILTSAIFEHKKRLEDKLSFLSKFPSENPNPVLRIAKDGTVLYANTATKSQLSELKVEIGQPAPPHLRQLVADVISSDLGKEVEVKHGDRIFMFTLAPVTDNAYVNVYGLDITERKQAEKMLRENEENLRALINSMNDFVFVLDLDGTFKNYYQSSRKRDLYTPPEEFIGKHFRDVLPPHVTELLQAAMKRIETSDEVQEFDYYLELKGEKAWYNAKLSPMKDHSGRTTSVTSVVRNITERKKAEEELIRLSNAVKTSTDSIVISDLDGKIIEVNEATLKMYGTDDKRDLIGKNSVDLIVPEEREKPLAGMKEMLEKGYLKNREYNAVTKNGSRIPVNISTAIMKDANDKPTGFVTISRDITERKQAEEQVKQLQEHLQLQVERMPIGLIVWDLEFRAKTWNPAATKIFGFPEKEALGKHPYDLIVPKQAQPHVDEIWSRLLKGDETAHSVNENLTKDGRTITCAWSNTPLKKDDGKVIGVLSMIQDITERKKAEEELETKAKLLDAATDAIRLYDFEGNILYVNEAACELAGYSKEELMKMKIQDLNPPEHTKQVGMRIKELREKGEITRESIHVRKDKSTIPVEVHTRVIKSGGKKLALSVVRDITGRKQMEEKLKQYSEHLEVLVQKRTNELSESEKKYSVLVEEASDGVAIVQDGKIVFVNKKASEIAGYSRDELIGLSLEKLVDEKYHQLVKERYVRRMRGETLPATYEVEFIAKTSECIPVELSATRIQYQGRPADLIIVRDTSERKRMEEQNSKLERLAAIGEIAGMVGHDLRNPLTGIKNAAYYLKKKGKECTEGNNTAMLEIIDSAVEHANKIVNDLLEYSREIHLELEERTPCLLLAEALMLVQVPERIKLLDQTHDEPKMLVDVSKMIRIFVNLIKNAIDAMPKGGTLEIRSSQKSDKVEFAFIDKGTGISEESMAKLFTPLFTTKAQGMGFGLAICKRVVEAHGGKIMVESVVDKGTTFTVTLPLEPKSNIGGEKTWVIPQESLLLTTTKT
jgi:PAS domain S-box-containing protein